MDDEGVGLLFGIMIIVGIAMAAVMLIGTAMFVVLVVGSVFGMVVAVINFVKAARETLVQRKMLHRFKNESTQFKYGTALKGVVFEDCAAKIYIIGPLYSDIITTIKEALVENFQYTIDFSDTDKDNALFTLAAKIFVIGKGISVYVFGTLFTIAISLIFLLIGAIGAAVVFPIIGVILLFETIYFKIKQINYRCTICKKEYKLPKYICPGCGAFHTRLKPGRFGFVRRRCLCGAYLPMVAKVKGYNISYSGGKAVCTPITFDDMTSQCPFCGQESKAGLAHTISIALVGGMSAGKTTFKVAFQHEFLSEEVIRQGIDFSFPDQASEEEYEKFDKCFIGRDLIPATNSTAQTDITTFCVNLKNEDFDTDRMLQIYDLPGEVFVGGEAKESWEHYSFTEGAVFLIDPFSLDGIKEQNDTELQNSSMGICTADMNVMIERMIYTLNNVKVRRTKSKKLAMPIALAISKVDTNMLSRQCGELAIQQLMEGAPEVFSNKFEAMDYACRCFLSMNGGDGFIENLDSNFETVHFFSCSAVGFVPKKTLARFSPKNVREIMQWLIIRADKKNIGSVWKPALPVSDIPDEKKQLYKTNREYYEKFVLNMITN